MARILIVDDDVHVCKWIRQFFEQQGYEVFEAHDGEQGIKILRENHADLVIIDIFMPKQGGISTMMQVRSDFPGMKMIVISGGGGAKHLDFLEMASELGAHRILQKPFSSKELLDTVQELLPLSIQQ
jgi:DNA-binding response OmpR family regulator